MKKIFVLVNIIFLLGCKNNSIPNPCMDLRPVNVGFKIYEFDYSHNKLWDNVDYPHTDTCIGGTNVFEADIQNAKNYTWKIGNVEYQGSKIKINFSNVGSLKIFPITLIVQNEPNRSCFPNDNYNVTLTKNFVIADNSLLDGKFEGYWEGSMDSVFVIDINCNKTVTLYTNCFLFKNYNRLGDSTAVTINNESVQYRYSGAVVKSMNEYVEQFGYDSVDMTGVFLVKKHNHIIIEYSYRSEKRNPSATIIKRKFIGKRIN